jgi:autophagy-related protein 2
LSSPAYAFLLRLFPPPRPYISPFLQISGTSTLSTLVQDIWTPDVKAHQLADVISGIAPVRSVVNVGAGVANLVLLPIEQYRKDGRVVRGLQKGAHAFAKQTTLEAINVGAKLATGTQVILEQAEHVLGANFDRPVAAEAVPASPTSASRSGVAGGVGVEEQLSDEEREVRSRYADQPNNVKQGVESAYRGLRENLKEGAQTILAVPMEVYERAGTEVRFFPSSFSFSFSPLSSSLLLHCRFVSSP